MLIRIAICVQSGVRLVLGDRVSGVSNASDGVPPRKLRMFSLVLPFRELLKKSAVTISNFAIWTKSRSENERNVREANLSNSQSSVGASADLLCSEFYQSYFPERDSHLQLRQPELCQRVNSATRSTPLR